MYVAVCTNWKQTEIGSCIVEILVAYFFQWVNLLDQCIVIFTFFIYKSCHQFKSLRWSFCNNFKGHLGVGEFIFGLSPRSLLDIRLYCIKQSYTVQGWMVPVLEEKKCLIWIEHLYSGFTFYLEEEDPEAGTWDLGRIAELEFSAEWKQSKHNRSQSFSCVDPSALPEGFFEFVLCYQKKTVVWQEDPKRSVGHIWPLCLVPFDTN